MTFSSGEQVYQIVQEILKSGRFSENGLWQVMEMARHLPSPDDRFMPRRVLERLREADPVLYDRLK